ncbi:TcaA 3rd/4th domain-containing protein [Lysinibacillus sp. NPDC093216]|uniref:TcaA 3rd/4th domain-containing protein n=1 Tax=Lysinibacillus sp. NPDC093216 TaxID=3390576 RepID=UPI003D007C00
MRQCQNCGKQALSNEKFCLECGTKLSAIHSEETDVVKHIQKEDEEHQNQHNYFPKKSPDKVPMSTTKKVIIGSIFAILALLVGGHFIIKSQLDPQKQLANLNKYFIDEDYEKFAQSFRFPDETIIDSKAFFNYMESQDWTKNINPELEEKLNELMKKGYSAPITNTDDSKLITIRENSFLLFYKKYTFDIQPIELSVNTVSPVKLDTKFKLGKLVSTELSDEVKKIGKFAPGIYTYNLSLQDEYFQNEIKGGLTLSNTEDNKKILSIDLADYQIHLTSDIEDAIVFINGKSTGKKAQDVKLFAAKLDDSVKVYAVKKGQDGQEEKSEIITLNNTENHLQFTSVQAKQKVEEEKKANQIATQTFLSEYEDSARSLFYDFRNNYKYALENADFSYVQDYFLEGTQIRKDYSKFVTDHNTFGYYSYDFKSNMIDKIYATDPSTIILDSTEIFDFYQTEDGTWSYQREKRYTMKLSNDTLHITDIQDRSKVIKNKISD